MSRDAILKIKNAGAFIVVGTMRPCFLELETPGVKQAAIAGNVIYRDAVADASVRQVFFDGLIRDWQVIVPDFGTLAGPFQVTALEYSGEHNCEISYRMKIEPRGYIDFITA